MLRTLFALFGPLSWIFVGLAVVCCAPHEELKSVPSDLELPIQSVWSGDFPVASVDMFPQSQRQNRVGYFGDAQDFQRVWEVFMPEIDTPSIDFDKEIVLFIRNTEFYNRTKIFKVSVTQGVAEVFAMETMSALPIESFVAMSMVAVPRENINAIRLDESKTLAVDEL